MPHPLPSARTAAGAADRAGGTVAAPPAPRVRVEHEGPVAVVVLEDPARRNVLGAALREQLHETLGRLAEDPGVRAVVLTGADGCFSAGGDLAAMPPAAPAEGRARMERIGALVRRLAALDLPVVAAVQGPAAGVAVGLVCCCDVVVAGAGARFLLPFTRLGLVPDGGLLHLLARRVGPGRARVLLLGAEPVGAEAALAAGLADHVVADRDVRAEALARAQALAARAPLAVAAVKQGLRTAGGSLEDALAFEAGHQPGLFTTTDFLEGKQAFAERRAPAFSGR